MSANQRMESGCGFMVVSSRAFGSSLVRLQHAPSHAFAHPLRLRNCGWPGSERGYVMAADGWRSVEAEGDGGGCRLAAVGDVELDEDVGDVGADGAGAE